MQTLTGADGPVHVVYLPGTDDFNAPWDQDDDVRDLETDLLPTLSAEKLGLLPYFPLANGLLTGKYRAGEALPEGTRLSGRGEDDKYLNAANLRTVDALREFAEARGRTLLELAFSWLLNEPVVSSVIAGATKPEQVQANAQAASWRLTDEEIAEIDEITGQREPTAA